MERKLAILDCDNVLLNYTQGFKKFIQAKGLEWYDSDQYSLLSYLPNIHCSERVHDLICDFNESTGIGLLYPNAYAPAYVEMLKEQGYYIGVMSSFYTPNEPHLQRHARTLNLESVFGHLAFDYYDYLPLGGDKNDLIKRYCENFDEVLFVDDNPEVIQRALEIDVDNLVVKVWDQPYNRHLDCVDRISVKTFIEGD